MKIFKITFQLFGKEFQPKRIIDKALEFNFHLFDSNEVDDLIWDNRSDVYDYGSLSIVHPNIFCLSYELNTYETYYSTFFQKFKSLLLSCGLQSITYTIDVFYVDTCNTELSCSSVYKEYMDFEFSIPINIYKVKEQEIVDMLLDSGYSLEYIEGYQW